MAFPILGTPKPQFFDSSGNPLVAGTLSVLNPTDDTNKASYPTYDDAEALTNANANPITLDSRGEPSVGLWGLDEQDYKLTLKDSSGNTVWTTDDINLPAPLGNVTQATIAAALWPTTAEETAAGVTPTNFHYEPYNLLRYGATGDGVTDDAAAIQVWVTLCAGQKVAGYAPAGHYKHSLTITQKVAGSRLKIYGDGRCAQGDFTGAAPTGTVFDYTASTGNGWEFGDGSTANIRGFNVSDMSFWGNTTGDIMSNNTIQDGNVFRNLFFGNNGTGGGCIILDMWVSSVEDIYCVGVGSGTSLGTGFQWANDGSPAGVGVCNNVNGKGFSRGVVLGTEDSSGKGMRAIRAVIQGIQCDENVVIGSAVTNSDIVAWSETCVTCGVRIFNQANYNSVRVYSNDTAATEASVVIGKSGGTATERTVKGLRLSGSIVNIRDHADGRGLTVYGAGDANDNMVDRVAFTGDGGGLCTAIELDTNSEQGWVLDRPSFTTVTTEVTGTARVDDWNRGDAKGIRSIRYGFGRFVGTLDDTGTPSVANGDAWKTGGTTNITDFLNGSIGQELTVISKHAITFDTTGTNLIGSTVDLATNSADVTKWINEDGTNWRLIAFVDASVDNSAGA